MDDHLALYLNDPPYNDNVMCMLDHLLQQLNPLSPVHRMIGIQDFHILHENVGVNLLLHGLHLGTHLPTGITVF